MPLRTRQRSLEAILFFILHTTPKITGNSSKFSFLPTRTITQVCACRGQKSLELNHSWNRVCDGLHLRVCRKDGPYDIASYGWKLPTLPRPASQCQGRGKYGVPRRCTQPRGTPVQPVVQMVFAMIKSLTSEHMPIVMGILAASVVDARY